MVTASSVALAMVSIAATAPASRCFPSDFLFGGATSALQVEGAWNVDYKTQSVWNTWCRVVDGLACANVADDLFGRYKDDIALVARDGHSSFRFSISWPRVMTWNATAKRMVRNDAGLKFYHAMIDELLQHKIEPVLTLYHWDMPVEFVTELKQPGWLDAAMIDHFVDFADLLFRELGTKVKYWATFNEPLSFVNGGYGVGQVPPGISGAKEVYATGHNVLLAHSAAVKRFRELKNTNIIQAGARISIALNYDNAYALDASNPLDAAAAERVAAFEYRWWMESIVRGEYPAIMRERIGDRLPTFTPDQAQLLKGSYDLFMLNHYSSIAVTDCNATRSTVNCSALPIRYMRDKGVDNTHFPEGARLARPGNSLCGNFNGYPQGFRDTLRLTHAYDPNAEILITESGWCGNETIQNTDQLWYFETHVEQVYKTIVEDHIPVIGYHAWSLVDNYEWGSYKPRFGLYYVNFTADVGGA